MTRPAVGSVLRHRSGAGRRGGTRPTHRTHDTQETGTRGRYQRGHPLIVPLSPQQKFPAPFFLRVVVAETESAGNLIVYTETGRRGDVVRCGMMQRDRVENGAHRSTVLSITSLRVARKKVGIVYIAEGRREGAAVSPNDAEKSCLKCHPRRAAVYLALARVMLL